MIAPHRYIQGNGVIDLLGLYLETIKRKKPILFITKRGEKRFGERLRESLDSKGIPFITAYFETDSTWEEVERHVSHLKGQGADCLVAVGGGKCMDTGKLVAHQLSLPTVICPTVASTDAPCSAVAVIYTLKGEFDRPVFFPEGPSFVIVDTGIIVKSPPRLLVAGMGDALATYYEARTCLHNPNARNVIGSRPPATISAIAKLGADLLYENGVKAIEDMKRGVVSESFENVIEANTLISGIGFESGGLAGSHGIAQVFPAIKRVEENYLHGEMVAFGIIAQLCLENELDEARRVSRFLIDVGLPTHLHQLSLDPEKTEEIDLLAQEAINAGMLQAEPFEVTADLVRQAILKANRIGMEMTAEFGDKAYREIHQ